MADDSFLPPVIIDVRGDSTQFLADLAADKAALLDFANTLTQTQLGADSTPFQSDLGGVRTELLNLAASVTDAEIGADSAEFQAGLAEVRAELLALASSMTDAPIGAESLRFQETLALVKGLLGDLAAAVTRAPIGADSGLLQTDIGTVKAELLSLATSVTDLGLGADTAPFWAEIAALKGQIDAMAPESVAVDANVAAALARIAELKALVDATRADISVGLGGVLPTGEATYSVSGEDVAFRETLAADKAALIDLANTITQTQFGANSAAFQESLASVKAELLELANTVTQVGLGLNSEQLQAELGAIRAELVSLASAGTNPIIGANPTLFEAYLAQVKAELAILATRVTEAPVGVDSSPFQADLAVVKAELLDLASVVTDVQVATDIAPLQDRLAEVKTELLDLASIVTEAQIHGDPTLFDETVGLVRAQLLELARTVTQAPVGVNQEPFEEALAGIKAELLDVAASVTDARIGVDPDEFQELLGLVKSQLAVLGRTVTRPPVGADDSSFQANLAFVKSELVLLATRLTRARIGADAGPFWAEILALKAELSAMGPDTVDVDANIAGALAKIATLKAAIDATRASLAVSVAGSAAAGAAGGAASGAAGGGASLLSELGVGGGFAGFASFGSIASLAGFGFEHVLTTAIGLVGSLAGAITGGLVLALTSASIAAVGFGTDLAGIGQAAGDIKNVYSGMTALTTAIGTYGAGSTQAADAQAQLNYTLTTFNPVARGAVVQAALMAQGFKAQFDSVTGYAEKTGAQIISQFIGLADKFLPTIGKFATENMTIIQTALQPLIAWLGGPGLRIFTELENKFQKDLPTAMAAFTNGVELLVRTLGLVAPYTGRLIADIARFTERMNGAGWSKWSSDVLKLIGLFRVWSAFVVILVKDIADLFGFSAGLGSGIIQTLTGYLNQLHTALLNTGKGSGLSNLFATHKAEVLELIKVVIQLGAAFTKMYLIAAPFLVQIATLLLQLISGFVTLVSKIPGGADLLGISLLASRMGILSPLLFGAAEDAGLLTTAIGGIGKASGIQALVGLISGGATAIGNFAKSLFTMGIVEDGVAASTGALAVAFTLLNVAVLGGAALGIYELVKHFGALRGLIIGGGIAAGVLVIAAAFGVLDAIPVVALITAIGLAIVGLVAGIVYLATHWAQVWGDIKTWTSDAVSFVRDHLYLLLGVPVVGWLIALGLEWREIWDGIKDSLRDVGGAWNAAFAAMRGPVAAFVGFFLAIPRAIEGAWGSVVGFFERLPRQIGGAFAALPNIIGAVLAEALKVFVLWPLEAAAFMLGAGLKISMQLVEGLVAGSVLIGRFFLALPGRIASYVVTAGNWLLNTGIAVMTGLYRGLVTADTTVANFFLALPGRILGALVAADTWLVNTGIAVLTGLYHGIVSAASAVWNFFTGLPGRIAGYLATAISWLTGPGGNIITGLWHGIQTAWTVVAHFFAGLPSWAAHVMDGAVHWLEGAGEAVVRGLLNGLEKGWKDVTGWIGGAVHDVIHSFLTGFGIASPAAKLIPVGAQVTQGLTVGMQSTAGQAVATAKSISAEITKAFGSLSAVGPLASAIASLKAVFSGLAVVFTDFGKAASKAEGVSTGLPKLIAGLHALATAAGPITTAVDTVQKAFAKLGGAKELASLAGVLGKLDGVLSKFAAAARAASGVTLVSAMEIVSGLGHLLSAAPAIEGAVKKLDAAFAPLGKTKGLSTLNGVLTSLGSVFSNFAKLAKSASEITQKALLTIGLALAQLEAAATPITSAIEIVVSAFSGLDISKTVGTELSNLGAVLGSVGKVFSDFGALAKSASGLTQFALDIILAAFNNLHSFADKLVPDLQALEREFGKLGNMNALESTLSGLNKVLGDLGSDFTNLGKASSDAATVIPTSLGKVTTAIQNLAKSLGTIPYAIALIAGPAMANLQSLVSQMTGFLASKVGSFVSAGAALMQGLSYGIASAAGAVARAAANAATGALAASKAATKTSSPSLLFAEEAENWMLGLVQGIENNKGRVQGALTGSLPTVPNRLSGVSGVGGGLSLNVTANFTIQAPGGNVGQIKNAIEQDSAEQFSKQVLQSIRSGAGAVYQ